MQRQILLGSQVAKEKGYGLSDIKATRRFSRLDYAALGGFAALAVTISTIGFVVAV